MKSQIEYFDVLVNTQKQVIGNIVSAQKELHAQIVDATEKATASIAALPVVSELPAAKTALEQFNTWLNTATESAEVFKLQENLISAYEKQLDGARNFLKNMVDISVKTTA